MRDLRARAVGLSGPEKLAHFMDFGNSTGRGVRALLICELSIFRGQDDNFAVNGQFCVHSFILAPVGDFFG